MGCKVDYQTYVAQKNIHWLAPYSSQWNTIWVSSEFQDLMGKAGWLRDEIMPYISSRPLGWFDPPESARFYFSSWLMNCVMRRTYSNPLIQDLYVLHEALHAASLDEYFLHAKKPTDALRSNEIQVSLETECWIYLRYPQWVGRTFPDLWVMQPHIQQQMNDSLSVEKLQTPQELELHTLAKRSAWPIRPLCGEMAERLWWIRRRMNTNAQTSADHTVARYERMADKWIAQIANDISLVQQGREKFNLDLQKENWTTAVDNWTHYLNQHLHNGLPFGDLQLRGKA